MGKTRSIRFDFLKTIAIVSVIFYHIGVQEYGYLGVDVFFVVGGYFLGNGMLKALEEKRFKVIPFLFQKIMRLWPLLLIGGGIALIIGAFVMLPDDYENLAQSVVASNVFANNILSAITTRNYWDVVNDFKPLMHTWYVGVLVQSYVVFAIVAKFSSLFKENGRKVFNISIFIISLTSFILYLLPAFLETHEKFYYIPTRLFEIGIGILIAGISTKVYNKVSRITSQRWMLFLQVLLLLLIVICIALPYAFILDQLRLIITVALTSLTIILFSCNSQDWDNFIIKTIAFVGKASFSFYVWHQIIVAFVKYVWCANLEITHIIVCIALICAISIPSYFLLEIKLNKAMCNNKVKAITLVVLSIVFLITTIGGLIVNKNAGYVRDIPELGIMSNNIESGMHASYCDRGYQYDKDFSNDNKIKVLVIGNSFGRDFSNILLESEYADKIELSYSETIEKAGKLRADTAEIIFYVVFGNQFQQLPEMLTTGEVSEKVYVVGNKNFGDNNGNIYNRRYSEDYFESSVELTEDYFEQNERLKKEFKESYIDLITPLQKEDGTIRVFTDDEKFISQDCRHLTVYGARYYSKLLDFDAIFARDIQQIK